MWPLDFIQSLPLFWQTAQPHFLAGEPHLLWLKENFLDHLFHKKYSQYLTKHIQKRVKIVGCLRVCAHTHTPCSSLYMPPKLWLYLCDWNIYLTVCALDDHKQDQWLGSYDTVPLVLVSDCCGGFPPLRLWIPLLPALHQVQDQCFSRSSYTQKEMLAEEEGSKAVKESLSSKREAQGERCHRIQALILIVYSEARAWQVKRSLVEVLLKVWPRELTYSHCQYF